METRHVMAQDHEVVNRWPSSRRSVPRARRQLAATLAAWGMPELRDAAELVLSELLTNAVRHARTPPGHLVETRIRRLPGDRVRLEVHDANDGHPVLRDAEDTDESGRGLLLVDALTAHQWGVDARPGLGKLVWAVVSVPDDAVPWP
jgi:anti-sigma regulatory factor (Ser/Thr protein kinase)